MIIVSFDCGIKNLAVCVVEISKVKSKPLQEILSKLSAIRKFIIKLQKVIPRGLSRELQQHCDNIYKYSTQKRFKILFWNNINLFPLDESLKKMKCSQCKRKAVYYLKSRGFCTRHSSPNQKKIKERSVKQISMTEINLALVKVLDSLPILLTADHVLIEQQPTKNPKMKTFQAMLYGYFLIRGMIDTNRIKSINFVSPKYKLRSTDNNETHQIQQFFQKSIKKKKYDQRKDVSVQRTRFLLDPEWNKFLDSHKRKADDLCDAFLQAYSFFDILNK